jgi:hypothetical protein
MATVDGTAEYGLVFAQRNRAVTYGGVEYGPSVVKGYLNASGQLNDGGGNLWLDLIPNLAATPADGYYVVTLNIQGHVHAEIWIVPDVASVAVESVRQAQPPGARGSPFDLANATGLLPLAHGGTNQSSWAAARCVRVNDAGTQLESAAGDCGTGGGSVPMASATVSGTVKTDTTAADPVVYLKTSADTLLAGKASSVHTHSQNDVTNLTTDLAGKESLANKNQANGYAGLSASSKLAASQMQEVLAAADLTDFAGTSGSGTTAIKATVTTPSDGQCLTWNNATTNWINGACSGGSSNHNLLSASHPDTAAASPVRGDLIVGMGASPAWQRYAKGTQYQVLTGGANEPTWSAVALDQATAISGILGSANGGTANGFTKFTGPTTSEKTFTLPNASATVLTTNALVTTAQGGTGVNSTATFPSSGTVATTATVPAAGTCTNQVVTGLTNGSAPTCTTITSSYTSGTFPPATESLALAGLSDVSGTTGSGSTVPFATGPTLTNLTSNQAANGDTAIKSVRNTDSSPTGYFARFFKADGTTELFSVDKDGAMRGGASGTSGKMTLYGSTSGTAAMQAPSTVTTYTWTLPGADSSGCLQSNGSGTLSIGACGSAGADTALDNLTSPTAINQHFLFGTDNSKNIGATGATRPANIYVGTALYVQGSGAGVASFTSGTNPSCGSGEYKIWANTSDAKLKKCENTTISDLDTTGGGTSHTILSSTHTDTDAATVVLGDLMAGNATPHWQRVAGNTSTTKNFLTQTGNGSISALPSWGTIDWADVSKTSSSLADLATRASTNLSDSSSLVRNNAGNAWSTGAQDFGSATSLKIPVAAGAAPATSGFIAYDSTNNNFHGGLSSADSKFASFTITPAANNNCVKWVVSGSNYLLGDAGAACGSGGGANTALSNLASVAINDHLTFGTDNSKDIGATGANRPANLYLGTALYVQGSGAGKVDLTSGTAPSNPGSGVFRLYGNSGTGKLACLNSSGGDCFPSGSGGVASLDGLTGAVTTAIGTTGTAPNWSQATTIDTLNIPMAATTSVTAGLISKTQYDTFNGKPDLVTAGSSGTAAYNAGTATTAARSDHEHMVLYALQWFFPGTVVAGVQTARGLIPEGVEGCSLTNSRISVNTTGSTSSTYNIQRCTTAAGDCTATSNIYSSNVTLNSSTQSVAGGTPDTTTVTAGDAFKVNLVSVGTGLGDVTVALNYKCKNNN